MVERVDPSPADDHDVLEAELHGEYACGGRARAVKGGNDIRAKVLLGQFHVYHAKPLLCPYEVSMLLPIDASGPSRRERDA